MIRLLKGDRMGLVVKRWRSHGLERLYVNDDDTMEGVGFYDYSTGRLVVKDEDRSEELLEVLRPFLGSTVPDALRDLITDGAAALSPKSDLLRNRGEQIVNKRLSRLKKDGWQVLPSVVKRTGTDIDHVVIGSPGVFTVNTKHHRGARVWVGEHVIKVDNVKRPYLRNSQHEAESAAHVLTIAVGLDIRVTAVLAFVGAESITFGSSQAGVLVTRGEEIDQTLLDLPALYSFQERDRILAAARRAEIWLA
jgi:hypothetical protein